MRLSGLKVSRVGAGKFVSEVNVDRDESDGWTPPEEDLGSTTLIGLAEKLADDPGFAAKIAEHRDRLGMDHARYGFVNTLRVQIPSCNTYPSDWTSYYYQEGFHTLDPLIAGLHNARRPIFLDEMERIPAFRRIWMEHAAEFNITPPTIGIPMAAPQGETAIFILHGKVPEALFEYERKSLLKKAITRAMEFHEQVINSYGLQEIMGFPDITQRELHCLELIARGLTVGETARDAGISERTVESHLKSCRKKFDAKTTPHAVARAVYLGMITPS